jgi:hypothetical protein
MNATMEIPTEIKRHPIRGFLWGIITGIGVALILIVTKVITLSIPAMVITIVVVALLATLWGLVGPAKKARGPVPITITPSPAPSPSRFDDYAAPAPAEVAPVPDAVEDIAAEVADTPEAVAAEVADAPEAVADVGDEVKPESSDDV